MIGGLPRNPSHAGRIRSAPPADGRRASRGPSRACRSVLGRRAVRSGSGRRSRSVGARPSCRCIECYFDTSTQSRVHGPGVGRGRVAARNRSHSTGARIVHGCALSAALGTPAAPLEGVSGCEGASRSSGNAAAPPREVDDDGGARLGSGGAPRRATNRRQSRSASSSSSASQTRALFRRLDMVRTAGISAPRTTPSTVQGDRLEPALEATSARLHRIGFGPIHDPVIPGVHHRAAEGSAACSAGCVMTGTRRPAPQYGFGVEPSRRGPPGNASVSSSST